MAVLTKIFDVIEDTSGTYTGRLVDETGTPVSSANIDTATLSLYDTADDAIINSRSEQNVLNANQVTIDTSGLITWAFLAADMPRLHFNRLTELHTALFIISFDDEVLLHKVSFRIHPLAIEE